MLLMVFESAVALTAQSVVHPSDRGIVRLHCEFVCFRSGFA